MEKYRIQDDLYEYVNHEWLEQAVIPDDKPTAGGFADLAKEVEENLIADFNEMSEKKQFPNDYLRRAILIYEKIKDVKKRNKDGIRPALKRAKKLLSLKDMNAFNRQLKELLLSDYPLPFGIYNDVDMKETSAHALYVNAPSTILPDVTYYKGEMEEQGKSMLQLWSQVAKQVLSYTKLSEEEINLFLADTLKFDAIIATLVKSSEENSDYVKSYNPTKTRTVSVLMKPVKVRKLVQSLIGEVPSVLIVSDPRFLKGFHTLFNEENFQAYIHWAYVLDILGNTNLLSEELREVGSSYRRALYGIKTISTVEKFAYQTASNFFSEPVGLFYGEKYFGEEAKKDVYDMVDLIINKYKERVKKSEVLSEETKEKAILKLSTMVVKMGYPDKVDPVYDKFLFDEEASIFDIACSLKRIAKEDEFSHYKEIPDRGKWVMPGHLVNAAYNPFSNDITFPAAILQAPFYSIHQSRSQNLGGIGAVIGHEISHAFDNNGAQFDENGNLKNWWTKSDYKNFKKKTKDMIKEFDGIQLPWGKVNGTLVVSENIADNGGMAVTLDIMHDIQDSSFEEYFMNWARIWCLKAKDAYRQLLLSIDVHSPTILRANMQPRNFPEWYETFSVTKKDKMYLAPTKRVIIW